ncbi:MAG: NAD(P)/FAD-dependent oxidoreductase [Reichenbachiella sp.]
MKNILIIGNGISGVTAARHIRKRSDARIIIISGESDYFFSRTALMYIYMGHMKFEHTQPYANDFWVKNRIELKKAWVEIIDTQTNSLTLHSEEVIQYDQLILALGSKLRKFGWPGQDLEGVSGLYSLQDLERIEKDTKNIKHAVIVGGGLIGIELAEMLHSRDIKVTFLVREENFWDLVLPTEEAKMINQEILAHNIDLRLSTELKEIISDDNGRVKEIVTTTGARVQTEFVGLTVGVTPNIQIVKDAGIDCNQGILVDEYLKTSVKNVYAIGDCAELKHPVEGRKAIEQVWYTGRMMGETIARSICEEPTAYQPGVWFNSAKFFNIEYQTYGTVRPSIDENECEFLWMDDSDSKLIRIVYEEESRYVLGVNTFGIRMRHEVWNHWIEAKFVIDEVIDRLESANFDPEFFTRYEQEIKVAFKNQYLNPSISEKPTL